MSIKRWFNGFNDQSGGWLHRLLSTQKPTETQKVAPQDVTESDITNTPLSIQGRSRIVPAQRVDGMLCCFYQKMKYSQDRMPRVGKVKKWLPDGGVILWYLDNTGRWRETRTFWRHIYQPTAGEIDRADENAAGLLNDLA